MKRPFWMLAMLVVGSGLATMPADRAETLTFKPEMMTFKAEMSGANEVPPNASKGTGHAEATLDTATNMLTWTVTYSGLTGPAMGAHFHGPAELGKNAGIILPFKGEITSPIKGSATLTEGQAGDFAAGKWYVNVHTQANPGGEIRGQMVR